MNDLRGTHTFFAFEKAADGSSNPVVGEHTDIAFAIDQKNHWFEAGEVNDQQLQFLMQVAARGLHELFVFCFCRKQAGAKGFYIPELTEENLRTAIRRFVAVAWLLHSEMLLGPEKDGKRTPLSLGQLGVFAQVDCTNVALSKMAQAFAGQFNFHARVQKRQGSKANYAEAAIKAHGKVRRTAGRSQSGRSQKREKLRTEMTQPPQE